MFTVCCIHEDVIHKVKAFGTYSEAFDFCEDHGWQLDYFGGVWDLLIDY